MVTAAVVRRIPHPRLLLIAAALAVVSLSLQWGSRSAYTLGVYLPGWCHTTYDQNGYASLWCDAGSWTGGLEFYPVLGFQHPVRVYVVAAIVLVAVGLRRQRRAWTVLGWWIGLLGSFLSQAGWGSGRLLLLGALVVAAAVVHPIRGLGELRRPNQPGPILGS